MSELYAHIAATIRELRQLRGLSQEGLADLVAVPANTVSRWETGTYKPSAEDLDKLARAFEVSITVFFPESQRTSELSPAAQALLSATKSLNKDDLDEVTRYAEFRRARRMLEKERLKRKKPRAS
ncbi:MAG TPA: helix-turn-helix transcriptional regulator [Burkholderiales bacterium]|nr:helix-turn-helix transcriptional regulator [Burkholderiales bacterium]